MDLNANNYMTSDEIRRKNMRDLAEKAGSKAKFSRKADIPAQLVQNYIGKNPTKSIGPEIARKAEAAFELPRGWLDNDHSKTASTGWPFLSVKQELWNSLSEREKGTVEGYLIKTIEEMIADKRGSFVTQESLHRIAA